MLYFFKQTEIAPTEGSRLAASLPGVSGAFLNCLVQADTVLVAEEKLKEALQSDGYICVDMGIVEALEGVSGAALPELQSLIQGLEQTTGAVAYGQFHCYE
jgi:hypothetical protein